MNDIMKIVKSLEDSDFLVKDVTKTIKKWSKKRKVRFLGMFLDTFGASLLINMSARKGVISGGDGAITASKGTNRAG